MISQRVITIHLEAIGIVVTNGLLDTHQFDTKRASPDDKGKSNPCCQTPDLKNLLNIGSVGHIIINMQI